MKSKSKLVGNGKASPQEVIALCKEKGLKMVDMKFTDLPGSLQHFSIPVEELTEELFVEGSGFDGSSIRGFQDIHESDMLLVPDPETAFVDPVYSVPTLSIMCNVVDPVTMQFYSRDPRYVAQKAESFLKSSRIAETSYWGPELEFFIFDSIRFDQNQHSGYYFLDSAEGVWNSGKNDDRNLGHRPRYKEGYFPVPPTDALQDLRSEVVMKLEQVGIKIEKHHHEVATAGQGEIDMRFTTLTRMADNVMHYKYILKNVAKEHGMTATFMPKPLFMDNGSGMHTHQSLWKNSTNLFYDPEGYAGLSQEALYYVGGLLKHSPALLAFCAPTTNSYRRLVPGYEAPVNLAYSQRNRSACVRIPMYSPSPKAKRLEYRCPDPSSNPYLAFAAMLMAGVDGIVNKIDPGDPLDEDIYKLPKEEMSRVKTVPGSLEEVLNALEGDCDFLLRGGVFTLDLVESWLDYKRKKEVDEVRIRPHPYEFCLYYDI
ncbi:MAG: type I glutamate--ammonia ligase [Chloroflexi bacterium]|nr:type I glutamate--ammonia ligase [Chloroflexota bacterium]